MTGSIISSWSNLPKDITSLIMERLYYTDQVRFRAVCKRWRSTYAVKYADKFPWIMAFNKKDNNGGNNAYICYLYDPFHKQKYTVKFNLTEKKMFVDAKPRASKHGWVLFCKINKEFTCITTSVSLFFYNPFIKKIMKLPKLELLGVTPSKKAATDVVATFSTAPTSPDCVIFMLNLYRDKVCVSTCSLGDRTWIKLSFHGSYNEIEDVAYLDGVFYCVFHNDVMGAFDVELQEWKTYKCPLVNNARRSLIESDGNLLMFYFGGVPAKWNYFRFDPSSHIIWHEIESLDNRMIYMGWKSGCLSSISLPATVDASEYANTIQSLHNINNFGQGILSFDNNQFKSPSRLYDWREFKDGLLPETWIQPPQPRDERSDP